MIGSKSPLHTGQAVPQLERGLDRFVHAHALLDLRLQPVDDHVDVVPFSLVERELLFQLADVAVDAHAHEPLGA